MSSLHIKDIYVIHVGRQMRLLFILTQSGEDGLSCWISVPSLRVTEGFTLPAPHLVISHMLPLLIFSVCNF